MEMMENYLLYSVSVLLFFFFLKRQCAREKIRCIFNYFWNCLNPFLSSLQSTQKNRQKKPSFLFLFSLFFDGFIFQHVSLSSLSSLLSLFTFPFIFLFISTCFSLLFLFSLFFFFFSLSQCFSSLLFPQFHVPYLFSIAVLCIFFWIDSFFFSLLFLISFLVSSFFFFVSVSFLSCQTKCKNIFFETDFFEPSLFLCLISCFSSLRRPYSLSVSFFYFWAVLEITFLDFLFIYLLFGFLSKFVVVFGHTFQKISLILVRKITLGKNPCFRDFDIFFTFDLFFSCMILNFSFFVFFVQISCFFCLNLFVSVQEKNTSKNKLTLFIFVFTLLVLTLPELLSLVVLILSFFSVSFLSFFCLFMFPLLMFNCSPHVYLLSLMFLLFVFILFFLTLFIPF